MPDRPVPLTELAAAVQNAVQQVLAKEGAVPVDKLWVGFVAPENIATEANASKVAEQLGKEAGVKVQGSVASLAQAGQQQAGQQQAGQQQAGAAPGRPGHIIGLVYSAR
ncbi:MAG: hypothetical protein JO307_12015 [Bryobacterales bacterium]|nr:hypothetical protein [Bryobacterales bacterium]MBV9401408.1 hypothetical protein [Bryobacterales bacterium]